MLVSAQRAHFLGRELGQLAVGKAHRTADDAAGLRRYKAEDRQRSHRLAASRLADDAEGLASSEVERDSVDGAHDAICGEELGSKISHLQQRHMRLASLGSSRSRNPSPSMFAASTVTARKAPGMKMLHGAIWKKVRP